MLPTLCLVVSAMRPATVFLSGYLMGLLMCIFPHLRRRTVAAVRSKRLQAEVIRPHCAYVTATQQTALSLRQWARGSVNTADTELSLMSASRRLNSPPCDDLVRVSYCTPDWQ